MILKFRAIINPTTTLYFTIKDLCGLKPIFLIRELLLPWLREGNQPDLFTGFKNKDGVEVYGGDIIIKDGHRFLVKFGVVEMDDNEWHDTNTVSGFYLCKKGIDVQSERWHMDDLSKSKTIGNIHEGTGASNGSAVTEDASGAKKEK